MNELLRAERILLFFQCRADGIEGGVGVALGEHAGLAKASPAARLRALDQHLLLALLLELLPPDLGQLLGLGRLLVLGHAGIRVGALPERSAGNSLENGFRAVAYAKDMMREVEIAV